MNNALKGCIFLATLAVCCWLMWLVPAPAQTLAPPCSGEDDPWRCFDVSPAKLAEAAVTLEFECYDMAGAKVVLLQDQGGQATRYRILARRIDGCEPPG